MGNKKVQPQHVARVNEATTKESCKTPEPTQSNADDKNSTKQANRYYGVNGWLKFFAFIFLVNGIIGTTAFVIFTTFYLITGDGIDLTWLSDYVPNDSVIDALAMSWLYAPLSLAAAIAIINHRKIGKALSIVAHLLNTRIIVSMLYNIIWNKMTESYTYICSDNPAVGPCSKYELQPQAYPMLTTIYATALIIAILVILYFVISRRVRATLTKPSFRRS